MRFFMKKYIWIVMAFILSACAAKIPEAVVLYAETEKASVIDIVTIETPEEIPLAEPPVHNKIAETIHQQEESDNPPAETEQAKPIIALTFDDGPGRLTGKILDVTEKHGVNVTFCVVGRNIKGREASLKRAVENGGEVIGHSWNHQNLNEISADAIKKQLTETHEAIEAAVGKMPAIFRPPYGRANNKVRDAAKALGFAMITWSVDTRDWERITADEIAESIYKSVKDGSLVLCHELHEATVEAMDIVIPVLLEQGYRFVTVSELLTQLEGEWEPGVIYHGTR
jgi:peptidoglycan/xylan/chitin deacetylase (PgdA/CDA1 family)